MIWPWGLTVWLVVGLAAGISAHWLLPGPRIALWATSAAGVLGALFGGLLATLLGFGGLVSWDLRSLTTAALGAVLLVLVLRLVAGRPG